MEEARAGKQARARDKGHQEERPIPTTGPGMLLEERVAISERSL